MTRGQTSLSMSQKEEYLNSNDSDQEMPQRNQIIIKADNEEIDAHNNYFKS